MQAHAARPPNSSFASLNPKRLNFVSRARWSTRRDDNLILVARADGLIEIPHLGVELLLNEDGIQREFALDGQRAARSLGARVVCCDIDVRGACFRHAADLPARRQFDGDLIRVLIGEREVQRMHAGAVLEHVFFRTAEQADGHERAVAGRGRPTGHAKLEFGNERRLGAGPIRRVDQLHVDAGGNAGLEVLLEEFPAVGGIFVALGEATPTRLEAGVSHGDLALERS